MRFKFSWAASAPVVVALVLTGVVAAPADADTSSAVAASTTPSLPEQDTAGNHILGASIEAHEGKQSRARSLLATPQAVAAGTYTPGMDVSGWQPTVNWAAAYANGARFAYIKATEGVTYKSSSFSAQYSGAYQNGLIRGAYVYAQPSQASAVDTANYFVANGGGWSPDGRTLPPLLDIEYGSAAQGTCYGMSSTAMVNWISSFSDRMYALTGVRPGIYTTTDWWKTCTGNSASFGQNPHFVARYTSASTPGTLGASWATWTMWQWATSGTFEGDQDYFNGDMTALQAYAAGSAPVTRAPVTRIAGADAYATSAALSRAQYAPGVATVFIATRQDFPDALAGAAAAGKANGPVLLTSPTSLDSSVSAELQRLQPRSIVVLGGPAAVSDAVVASLKTFTTGAVSRQYGQDRFATAAAVAAANWGTSASTVYVSTGTNYPDAVAASAVAAAAGTSGPVLLTTSDVLSEPTRQAIQNLRPSKVVILGGTTAVSTQVQNTISTTLTAAGGGTVVRQAGSDRFETAAAVARSAYSSSPTVYISTGTNFPDALSGGPVAGQQNAPMLLVTSDSIPAATRKALLELRPSRVVIVGGTAAVSDAVAALL